MPKLSTTIAHHKLAFIGAGVAGLGYLHYRQTGSWLPSSMTGGGSQQQYMPGQQAPFFYQPGGVEPVNTSGGFSSGSGGDNPWDHFPWSRFFPPPPKHHKRKPKPKVTPPPGGFKTPGTGGGNKNHHRPDRQSGGALHNNRGHKPHDVNRPDGTFHRRGRASAPNQKSKGTDRVKRGGLSRGRTVNQRPEATTTGGGHPVVKPAARPSAPPRRNPNRQGRKA